MDGDVLRLPNSLGLSRSLQRITMLTEAAQLLRAYTLGGGLSRN